MIPEQAELAVLIPERGLPEQLAGTLAALMEARCALPEPSEVHVLVNGSRLADYEPLRRRYSGVRWHHRSRALGYHGAIRELLRLTRASWVYLLNSDMRLDPDALARVMAWRAPDVFAVASQIVPADRSARREETGWTVPVIEPDLGLQLHDLEPPDDSVRSHVYAGGGASLFRREALQRHAETSRAYAPFYFEDADWGIQAWADGLLVLHCPGSIGVHAQHATIRRFVHPVRIAAITARNLELLRSRYGDAFRAARPHPLRLLAAWPGLLRHAGESRRARARVLASPVAQLGHTLHLKRFPHLPRFRAGRPRVVLVSPFAVLPPSHGGARRILELVRASHEHIDWILLHDEAAATAQAADPDDSLFREIHPIRGRPDSGGDLASRWRDHAHPALRAALAQLLRRVQPQAVFFEHLECIGLVEALEPGVPGVWTLHDAGRNLPPAARQRVQAAIDRVRALVLTTRADVDCWNHPHQWLIENGVRLGSLHPARQCPDLLLMVAPLRYGPNRTGLARFLQFAWPALRRAHPDLRLRVLGGPGAGQWLPGGARALPAGVELLDRYASPERHYAECTLALNPQEAIEGSAIKIAEALAHARVIVSTQAGARGYERLDSPALRRVESIAAMVPAISALLRDEATRLQYQACARAAIAPWDWRSRAPQLTALLQQIQRDRA